jgi:hypothetical protein
MCGERNNLDFYDASGTHNVACWEKDDRLKHSPSIYSYQTPTETESFMEMMIAR